MAILVGLDMLQNDIIEFEALPYYLGCLGLFAKTVTQSLI